eukprot:jgi/Tetstr1/453919/TSEL_040838.t1
MLTPVERLFDLRGRLDPIPILFSKDEVDTYRNGVPDVSESEAFSTPLEIPERYQLYKNGRLVSRFCDLLVWDADEGVIIVVSENCVVVDTGDDVFFFHIRPGFEPATWEAASKLLLLVVDFPVDALEDADEIGECLAKDAAAPSDSFGF